MVSLLRPSLLQQLEGSTRGIAPSPEHPPGHARHGRPQPVTVRNVLPLGNAPNAAALWTSPRLPQCTATRGRYRASFGRLPANGPVYLRRGCVLKPYADEADEAVSSGPQRLHDIEPSANRRPAACGPRYCINLRFVIGKQTVRREPLLEREPPPLDRIESRRARRQQQQRDVGRDPEVVGAVPAGLIERGTAFSSGTVFYAWCHGPRFQPLQGEDADPPHPPSDAGTTDRHATCLRRAFGQRSPARSNSSFVNY
jgi:hypothetical protein